VLLCTHVSTVNLCSPLAFYDLVKVFRSNWNLLKSETKEGVRKASGTMEQDYPQRGLEAILEGFQRVLVVP